MSRFTLTAVLALSALAIQSIEASSSAAAASSTASPASSKYASTWTRMTITCQNTLAVLVNGESAFSKCSGAGKLFQDIVSNSAVDDESNLIPFIEKWLESSLCASDACPYSVTNAVGQNLTEQCAVDIKNGNVVALAAQGAALNYQAARRTLCLYDSAAKGNGTAYCPAGVLNNIATAGLPINYDKMKVVVQDPKAALESLPEWTYCNDCGHGMTTGLVDVLKNLDGSWGTTVSNTMKSQCGASFADGTYPNTLGDGTKTDTKGSALPNSTSSAADSTGSGSASADAGSEDGSSSGASRLSSISGLGLVAIVALGFFSI